MVKGKHKKRSFKIHCQESTGILKYQKFVCCQQIYQLAIVTSLGQPQSMPLVPIANIIIMDPSVSWKKDL